jgi:hypothetical protein
MPELLRLKGKALLSTPGSSVADAETCLRRSLALSQTQGALGWELRAAIDLAALQADEGRPEEARALLQPVLDRFEQSDNSSDLKAANQLMEALG